MHYLGFYYLTKGRITIRKFVVFNLSNHFESLPGDSSSFFGNLAMLELELEHALGVAHTHGFKAGLY